MNIEFVEQQAYLVFRVDGEYYRVSYERNEKDSNWAMRLIDVSRNETVYSKTLDAIVAPDIELSEEIVKTYISRG
ncbi:MAG TPA: hypothetical protein ENG03_07740 [Thioploca sp.]|nr:MAG: hypothetical protein DRR19_19425 [Gammaproteobacteria bacterium]HDN26971.1 hypothetical protein [Thioploca sp.]